MNYSNYTTTVATATTDTTLTTPTTATTPATVTTLTTATTVTTPTIYTTPTTASTPTTVTTLKVGMECLYIRDGYHESITKKSLPSPRDFFTLSLNREPVHRLCGSQTQSTKSYHEETICVNL